MLDEIVRPVKVEAPKKRGSYKKKDSNLDTTVDSSEYRQFVNPTNTIVLADEFP